MDAQQNREPLSLLPPLRDVIRELQLSARKSLGQNFILDLNVTQRIARLARVSSQTHVLEIGPGPGGLTRALLMQGAHVHVIEKDERFHPALQAIQERSQNRLAITFADALSIDYDDLSMRTGVHRVVSNLPYNIATPLIVRWLTGAWPAWFDALVVMVQKEVAERIVASPGTKDYGRLSVLAQFRCRPRILMAVPASVFTPPPKVASSLIEIVPITGMREKFDIRSVEAVTAAAFGQRRKMLRSSLTSLGVETEALLSAAGIDPRLRAENLDIDQFATLSELLKTFQSPIKQY